MTTQAKSIFILLGTLLIGGVLGGTVVGMIAQKRQDKRDKIQGPGGFVRHMERVIEIQDSAQHAVIHPILEATDQRNRVALNAARQQMAASFDSMLIELAPHLSANQVENLKREREHMKKKMKGPPGFQERSPGAREGGPPPQE